jgi:hypothetical protein
MTTSQSSNLCCRGHPDFELDLVPTTLARRNSGTEVEGLQLLSNWPAAAFGFRLTLLLIRASTTRSQHLPLPYTFPSSTTLINLGESHSSSSYLQYNKASKVQKPRRKANTTTQKIVVPATTRIFKQVFPIASYAMDTAQSFARATTAYILWGEVNFC